MSKSITLYVKRLIEFSFWLDSCEELCWTHSPVKLVKVISIKITANHLMSGKWRKGIKQMKEHLFKKIY
jgi:hypothetical protein